MKEYEMPATNLRIAQIAIVGRDPDGSQRELMRRLRQDDAIRVVAAYETLTLALAAGLGESVPADLVIVLQSYSDEFSPEEINALIGRLLFSRILCWHGPWCTADGRSHELWPVTFRVPVASAAALLELELTGLLAGDPPMFPMSAGEEVFAHRSTFLPLVEPPVRSTACVISNDFVLRDTVAEILGALQCQATVLPLAVAEIQDHIDHHFRDNEMVVIDLDGPPGELFACLLMLRSQLPLNSIAGLSVFAAARESPRENTHVESDSLRPRTVIEKTELLLQLRQLLTSTSTERHA